VSEDHERGGLVCCDEIKRAGWEHKQRNWMRSSVEEYLLKARLSVHHRDSLRERLALALLLLSWN
jgi:hypothetical protein